MYLAGSRTTNWSIGGHVKRSTGGPYKKSGTINDEGKVDYVKHNATIAIDKVTGHAIYSLEEGVLELRYFNWGEQPLNSGEMDVIISSDFSKFDGIEEK